MSWSKYTIEDLYEWQDSGSKKFPEDFVKYVNVLSKIYDMHMRFDVYGSQYAIVKHLVVFEPELNGDRRKANRLYEEAMIYFYAGNAMTNQVRRNMAAERLEKDAQVARLIAETPEEFEKVSRIEERAFKMRHLDKEDKQELPKNYDRKQTVVYAMDLDNFELPNENRAEIEIFLDENAKNISQNALDRIKQESLIKPLKIFQDEEENPRKK